MTSGNKKTRIPYTAAGVLKGVAPSGQEITVFHLRAGRSGYEALVNGEKLTWTYAGLVEDEWGIDVQRKKTGRQTGLGSEPALRAVWRYFVDRYNAGDPSVSLISS